MHQAAYAQALEKLRISAFVLEKETDRYIVREWEPSFLKSIADKVWGLADSGRRSGFCSANPYSMVIFFPSTHPSSLILAGTLPRRPRYQKLCLHPGNQCGRFSLSTARGRNRKAQRAKHTGQKLSWLLDTDY